ncbi:unnamed protein product [Peniophora sp. CBMAI 1063]|nr:unnamed protein product [Peniophora sp. CBMAI 1063]
MEELSRAIGPSPAKRQRLSLDTTSSSSLTAAPSPHSSVKLERSPSPSLSLPQTTGAKFYAMPKDCRRVAPNYIRNRSKFVAARKAELTALGLELTKQLWRSDGLVFDWKSNIPVMPDTLKPSTEMNGIGFTSEHTEISSASVRQTSVAEDELASPDGILAHLKSGTERIKNGSRDRRRSSSPRHGASKPAMTQLPPAELPVIRRDISRPSQPFTSSSSSAVEMLGSSSTGHNESALRPSSGSQSRPQKHDRARLTNDAALPVSLYDSPCEDYGLAEDWPDKREAEAMTSASLQYIERYVAAFDSKRASLADAYRMDAAFSYRRVTPLTPTTNGSATSVTGRANIARILSDIRLRVMTDSVTEIKYDVVHLGNDIGTMATVDGAFHEAGSMRPRSLPFRWVFILRRNPVSRDATWTLQATAHQMIVHDIS